MVACNFKRLISIISEIESISRGIGSNAVVRDILRGTSVRLLRDFVAKALLQLSHDVENDIDEIELHRN